MFTYSYSYYFFVSSASRLAKSWTDRLSSFVAITEGQFFAPVRPFLPRIKETAEILVKFTAVNLTVHTQTYNDLIATAVAGALVTV